MIPILTGIGIAYLGVAACAWWFVISTPKIGTRGRPLTFADKTTIARREGWALFPLALGWLPLLLLVIGNNVVISRREKAAGKSINP